MKTLFVGQKIIHLNSVDSTNNYTTGLARQTDIHEGLIVSAEYQTNGRGQRNSKWWAGLGENLTFSVLLKPKFLRLDNQFLLSMAVAIALKQTVESFLSDSAYIKWPNDIVVNKKKIAGILIENSLKGNTIEHSIVGVGLNVNGNVSEALPHATSIFEQTGRSCDREKVLELFCETLEVKYLQLRQHPNEIVATYNSILLGKGEESNYSVNGELIRAQLIKVENDGRMLLQHADGLQKHYWFKEINQPDIYR